MGLRHLTFMFACILMCAASAAAEIDIAIEGPGSSLSQGTEYLDSNLSLSFNEFIPKESWLYIFINNESVPRGEISLERYLHDEGYYQYSNLSFDYNITAGGVLRWNEYPEQEFWYRITVSGLCGTTGEGGCYSGDPPVDACDCPSCYSPGPPYPCQWSSTTGVRQGTVNGNPVTSGLKFIYDIGSGGVPEDAVPGSVKWTVQKEGATPPEVELAMKAVCGNDVFNGKTVWPDGWIIHTISTPSKPCTDYVPGGFDCRVVTGPFDGASLAKDYRRFGGPAAPYISGGVFKTNDFTSMEYQDRYTEVNWNGTAGEITIKDFDMDSTYIAVYLPPGGSKVCAYTSLAIPKSEAWSGKHLVSGASAAYLKPYVRQYARAELESFPSLRPPDCPIPPEQQPLCIRDDTTYGTEPAGGDVSLEDSFEEGKLTVTATVSKKIMTVYEKAIIELSEFGIRIADLTETTGAHTLRAVIYNGAGTFEEEMDIYVCQDMDGDRYCTEDGDCDDSNPDVNPGMTEICNGIDDDCNGVIDDGIAGTGEGIGKPCWDWPGSVCKGVYVCNPNGTELACKPESGIYPGDRPEYCSNMLDDDCDGAIDEDEGFVIDGVPQPKCIEGGDLCIEGQTRPCGECGDGTSTCANGAWGNCVGDRIPRPETCNRIDDDCDGVVDNLFGKESVEETKCRCYGGGFPSSEICNGIDDDCDGQIDEGVAGCCSTGDTMLCGTDTGACEQGIKECVDGVWGECKGAVMPVQEICCNGIDDDCDGQTDDGCGACDQPGPGPDENLMLYLSIIGLGVVLFAALLIYRILMKK